MSNLIASEDRIIKACSALFAAFNYSRDTTLTLDSTLVDAILKEIASWGLEYENDK